MTRKDYILIAAALKEARNHWLITMDHPEPDPATLFANTLEAAAEELADALARDNPRFDRRRFLKAAGVQPYIGLAQLGEGEIK